MGALATKALRPIKSFNIENRAHRVISKEKPTPAPRYPDNLEDLKRAIESDPDLDEKLDKKDPGLDNRLKEVYVTSTGRPEDDITREKQTQSKTRPLPLDRTMPPVYDFGFKEPDTLPVGRTTLRDATDFITAHQSNPEEVTAAKIAFEYKLREEDVQNILKYFKNFEVYLPKTKTTPAVFAGPATLRKQLSKHNVKELEGEKQNEELNVVINKLQSKK
ncbi:NADH dehydrogenase [ubiquinone] 1 alpha subcomplex assembly factor 4 [Anticarsia gemmatalis]|uniref:NADH dehydrogenase [ubiquinone] 1 alpha subcomplex assembly factor 4 n=1 Tax=Anticarsia gemmatalis TaxID=129554 RepID=UPI003F76465A